MGHSQAEKAQSHERIVEEAARQIRQHGLESISIGRLMESVNLTHGGFYGHFPSRSALLAAALEWALDGSRIFAAPRPEGSKDDLTWILNRYLSPAHSDNLGAGCAIAALATDAARSEEPELRQLMAERLEQRFERVQKAFGDGPEADEKALVAWSTMVGALALSRVFKGSPRSAQILKTARQSILDLAES